MIGGQNVNTLTFTTAQMNSSEKSFILHLPNYLPERKTVKKGTKPIDKYLLLSKLFKLVKINCGWREIKYSSTCRNYLYEIQKRSKFKKFLNFLTKDLKRFRIDKTIIDSPDLVS